MAGMCSQEVGDTCSVKLSLYYDLCNQVYISIKLLLHMSMFLSLFFFFLKVGLIFIKTRKRVTVRQGSAEVEPKRLSTTIHLLGLTKK